MFIDRIHKLFREQQIPFAIVGGYAVAIHGVARGTFDVDIITEISRENFLKIESALHSIGLQATIPVSAALLFDNLAEYKRTKNLIAWNFVNPASWRESVDILVTEDIRNYNVVMVDSDIGKLPVVDIAGLIQMKSKANREQDQKDIEALRKIKDQPHDS